MVTQEEAEASVRLFERRLRFGLTHGSSALSTSERLRSRSGVRLAHATASNERCVV